MKIIRGITWNHSRAFPPLIAAAQRYEELNPDTRIVWAKRTLDEFGHKPIDQLASEYDLIVIDHPWSEFCFDKNLVLDLKKHLTPAQWTDLEQNCVGSSFDSYVFEDKLLAIPIDTATPTPSWRPDLIKKHDLQLPKTWEDLIALSDKKHVIMPGFGADLFLNWLMFLHALDAHPFESTEVIADKTAATEAMSLLKRLAEPMPEAMFNWNPINIAEIMTTTDNFVYCPFAYSYSNYTRPSFTSKPLQYGNLISLNEKPLRSILGGTGIAISTRCSEVDLALDFSLYCASADVQSNIYTYSGGQPARKEAWLSEQLEAFTGSFFTGSYVSHKNALVRPRYNGYVPLQEKAGADLQQFIAGSITAEKAWNEIEKHYRQSRGEIV
ncbi:extracellular solute-binding protein [Bacteroidota bacterium]